MTSLRAFRPTIALAACAVACLPAAAQSLAEFEKKVTTHRLANGWTFLIVERPIAPVFSFSTYVSVGGAQEVPGITGLAHMFEHMAFKGTDRIGTKDYAKEKAALAEVEAAYEAYEAERRRPGADANRVDVLRAAWKDKQERAGQYVVPNEFGEIIDLNGGVGLNASTSSDETRYFYSMPSNKLEVWAYLESERFLKPVFREFYKERDVVKEERRMRTESTPTGRMFEQFIAAAFTAHSYGQPVVGYMSDLDSFSAKDAEAFYRTHYVPSNLVTALVGDVRAKDAIPLIERYFGRVPGGPPPPPVRTVEPPQKGERVVRLVDPGQPAYAEGYHRPAISDPDHEVYDALATILGGGRTSRLYRSLVRDQRLAAQTVAFGGFPGTRYPCLFAILGIPARGKTPDEVRQAIHAELQKIVAAPVTEEELARVKARAKADLVRGLGTNQGLANALSRLQGLRGDWRELFRSVERLDRVTQADVTRVANATFVETNRTAAYIDSTATRAAAQPTPATAMPAAK